MASESLVLDAVTEDASNTEVALEDSGNGIEVVDQDYSKPDRERLTASSADTFGDPYIQGRYRNRELVIKVRCQGTEAVMRARVADVTKKVGKLSQLGGTLKRTLNNGDTVVYDVLDADVDVPANWQFLHKNSVEVTIYLLCSPWGRGPEVTFSAASEATLPALVFTVTGVTGDLPARGRLVVDEQDADSQQFFQWGLECRNYPGASAGTSTAHLFYEAETRLPLNGATALALSGASGGTVINQATLTTSYAAMLSTASSGTAYTTHIGDFNVWARVYQGTANAGTVSLGFEWAQGDFRNAEVNETDESRALPTTQRGQFLHVPLGQVHLREARVGQQRWEGRVIAKSTTYGDDVAVDALYLFPVTEGYGEVRGVASLPSPTTFVAHDEFAQGAGALSGTVLPQGGTWTTSGAGTDLALTGGGVVTRTATTGTRLAVAGTTNHVAVVTGVDVMADATAADTSSTTEQYLIARWQDGSNHALPGILWGTSSVAVQMRLIVAATEILIGSFVEVPASPSTWHTFRCAIYADGRWALFFGERGGRMSLVSSGQDSRLATGGVLASGESGFAESSGGSGTRSYDNFQVWEPPADAALFASQSLRIDHESCVREDAAGTVWAEPGEYRGQFIKVPASNVGGTVRMICKGSRSVPCDGADSGIDDLQATLAVTPLYLHPPE
jgi:hypothetical protein